MQTFTPGVLNLFKHVVQLANKRRFYGPLNIQLLQCGNCCICTEQK